MAVLRSFPRLIRQKARKIARRLHASKAAPRRQKTLRRGPIARKLRRVLLANAERKRIATDIRKRRLRELVEAKRRFLRKL